MADSSSPYIKPHFSHSEFKSRIRPKPMNQGKSCSGFLVKSLFLALFVIVLPLFPPQAPDFVSQTILIKFWELLHLLFIGIAVTYGLFSRRNVEIETRVETHPSADSTTSSSYVSKMFPDSTIFGDECESGIPYGFDEKRMMHCWNPHYIDGGSAVGVFDEQYKTQFPISQGSFGYSDVRCDGNGTNVVQAWNSEYYHSEPVVVAQPNYTTGECGEVVGYRPLGLPVRSLRSVARDVDSPKYTNESDSSSGSSRGPSKSRDREFEDLDPSNSGNFFNDVPAVGGSASPIPWSSRSRRMERDRRHGNVARPSHFRPLSVDETKFEGLGQSTSSFSSHFGMYSSMDSISSDNVNFNEGEMRQKEAPYVDSEKMRFQEEDMGQETSYVPIAENMNFQKEDMGSRKAPYVSASENTSFQDIDLGKKVFRGSSRNRRMATKGKYFAASSTSRFRPMSVEETQFDSLGLNSLQSLGSFSSNTRMYSSLGSISSDMDFQEGNQGQNKNSHMYTSENMNFQEEDMGQEKTPQVHESEDVNFQEDDVEQEKTSDAPALENMDFNDVVDLGKKISQVSSSRNGMIESKGKYGGVSLSSNFRPMSADEPQFESLSSRSFQSMGSFSSQSSLCSSLDSISSEIVNSPKEDLGEKKSSRGSSSSSSPSALARRKEEASTQSFHARRYNMSSLLQDDIKCSSNDELRGEDAPGKKESGMHALQSDSEKPVSLAKVLSRGKSVRTRRASVVTSETMRIGEISSKQTDENVEKKPSNVESGLRKDKMKNGEPDLLPKGFSKKSLDSYFPKPEIKISNHCKAEKVEPPKKLSKPGSDIELEDIRVCSDEDDVRGCVNDSDLDSEVDKKASEFIAKFKAQIRLQKMVSGELSKEQKPIGNKIR